jgi:hypothetical protein
MTRKIPTFLVALYQVALNRVVETALKHLEQIGIQAIVLVNGAGGTSAHGIEPQKITPEANAMLQRIYEAAAPDGKTVKHVDYFDSLKCGTPAEATEVLSNEESFALAMRDLDPIEHAPGCPNGQGGALARALGVTR